MKFDRNLNWKCLESNMTGESKRYRVTDWMRDHIKRSISLCEDNQGIFIYLELEGDIS